MIEHLNLDPCNDPEVHVSGEGYEITDKLNEIIDVVNNLTKERDELVEALEDANYTLGKLKEDKDNRDMFGD
jgi:hypothetical protein